MKNKLIRLKHLLIDRLNLQEDRADEQEIISSIKQETEFKGPVLWTLVFAILIASVGLNVNSTAVIIGAMLISPIMGPIMGIGLAMAINDLSLFKKGLGNVSIAVFISILTSAIYFFVSPLHNVNSELLARTNPSIWDVLIAVSGGFAGIVAGTRKKKSNVIPGVAIATALMPPLCTAGYGLATGQLLYFFGALYLFFINCFFICLATFIVVKHLRFHKKEFTSKEYEKKVIRSIWIVGLFIMIPSFYLTYRIVQRSIFENNANNFVASEFNDSRTQVVNKTFKITDQKKIIELLIFGKELNKSTIDSIKDKLPSFGLNNTTLILHQGLDAKRQLDFSQIRASILEDVFEKEKQNNSATQNNPKADTLPDLRAEISSLFPSIKNFTFQRSVLYQTDRVMTDSVFIFTADAATHLLKKDEDRLRNWLKNRIHADTLLTFIREGH